MSQSSSSAYPAQYQVSQNQYPTTPSQYTHQSYPGSSSFQSQSSYTSNPPTQNSLYQSSAQTSSYQAQGSNSNSTTAYHPRDSQSAPANSYPTAVACQSSYQRNNQAAMAATSQTQPVVYSTQTYGSTHPSTLQTSPLTDAKLTESLSKMSVKDNTLENSQTSTQVIKLSYFAIVCVCVLFCMK